MKKKSNAILFLTHRDSKVLIDLFRRLSEAVNEHHKAVFAYHQSGSAIPENISKLNPFVFTDDILYGLNYYPILDSLLPGSNHFPLLKFYTSNPNYDYYWVIEDDVRFTGNWEVFFNEFSSYKHDFISSHIRKFTEFPGWYWWKTIAHPKIEIKLEDRISSFNPVYRISKDALHYIHESLLDKWSGHHEVLFPTLLVQKGFSILDFGGSGSYTKPSHKNIFYTDETMKYRPVFKSTGDMCNKLYHPVKDF